MDAPIKFSDQLTPQLKALRKLRGLSQAELGKRLGVSQARVAEIEAAPGLVSLDQWFRIFSALGVEVVLRTKDAAAPGFGVGEEVPKGRW